MTFRFGDLLPDGMFPSARRKLRECGEKARYASQEAADAAVAQMRARSETVKEPETLNSYQCSFCHGWHVGHRGAGGV